MIYQIQLRNGKSYLKFYKAYVPKKTELGDDTFENVLSDTIKREIKFITNNEFVTEYDSLGKFFEERFKVVE